jgi:isoquinoline 1-oxidoreductase beta subunit
MLRERISRRGLLVGGGAGAGLIVAWALWPRTYRPNVAAGPGEHVLNAFVKIANDGRVVVVVPQAELGQGVWTALPQALADELGADWRTVAVEAAPIGPLYANDLLLREAGSEGALAGVTRALRGEYATRDMVMATAASSSIRSFEQRFREAGAIARTQLCRAAAVRWDVDPAACDTAGGFVVRGDEKLRFAELAEAAGALGPPDAIELRRPGEGGLSGKPVPRLDLPAKVDGSLRYAGDVRLPGMVHAAVRHGPWGDTRLAGITAAPADKIPGVLGVIENPGFVAAIADNWWAANRALGVIHPTFATDGPLPDDTSITKALGDALAGEGQRVFDRGNIESLFAGGGMTEAEYAVAPAPHAVLEPLTATARLTGDRVEIWLPTQAPGRARAAVAAALGIGEGQVTLYQTLGGGGFGRKLEHDAAVEAAIIARTVKRPIQLTWSREEETMRGLNRPPARARLTGKIGERGTLVGLRAKIAAPISGGLARRLMPDGPGIDDAREAVAGAMPGYSIENATVDFHQAEIGVPMGVWPGMAHSYTAFFTESFVDEMAKLANVDPLNFRMRMLSGAPRLARCLATVTRAGGWAGADSGAGQGIALHASFGSFVAILAEVHVDKDGRIAADRIVAAVDCGRVIHPDIVRQQIEGGILFALGAALGAGVGYQRGVANLRNFHDMSFPRLADAPAIQIELLPSAEAPGGVSEIAVPPVAPAIANAVFAATGKRLRRLPLEMVA